MHRLLACHQGRWHRGVFRRDPDAAIPRRIASISELVEHRHGRRGDQLQII
jgi:hypothetical protein